MKAPSARSARSRVALWRSVSSVRRQLAPLRSWVRFFRSDLVRSAAVALLCVCAAALEGAISLGFAALVSPGKTGALAIPPSILLLATVARGTLQVVIAQSSIAVLERWRWRLRTHLVDRIFDDLTTASLVDAEVRLADGHHKAAAFVYQSAGLVPQLALASSIAAILLWLSPLRALVVFATLGASAGLALTFTRRQSRRHIPRLRELHRAFHRGLIRVLRNGAAVRAYGTERDEHRSLHDTVRQSAELSERLQRGIQAIGIVPGLGLSLVLLAAIVHAPEGDRASLLAFGLLSLRLGGLLGTMSKTGAHLQATYPFFREAVGDVRRRYAAPPTTRRYGTPPPPPTIVFDAVGFLYPNATTFALKRFSWKIPARDWALVEGPSGAGKSTLLALALGLLLPTEGTVTVDGVPAHEYWAGRRESIGYTAAEPMILAGSVRENLVYGNARDLDDGELLDALSDVGLASWIATRREGLDVQLGENGSGLSHGQRQRLALARNLLRRPSFLVLDDPVAALDATSAGRVLHVLERFRGRATVLVAAHGLDGPFATRRRLELEEAVPQAGTATEGIASSSEVRS